MQRVSVVFPGHTSFLRAKQLFVLTTAKILPVKCIDLVAVHSKANALLLLIHRILLLILLDFCAVLLILRTI